MFDLKSFRKENSIPQSEIKDLFRCSQPFVSRLENGKEEITFQHLKLLKEKYGEREISKYMVSSSLLPTISPEQISPSDSVDYKHKYIEALEKIIERDDEIKRLKAEIEVLKKGYEERENGRRGAAHSA